MRTTWIPLERSRRLAVYTAAGAITLTGLFVLSQRNFLLFHGLIEIFSIAVAWSLFLLVWNARQIVRNNGLYVLAISYAFVGLLDLVHTLAYKGTAVFPESHSANLATQLWIAARMLQAFSLLVYPFYLRRPVPVKRLLAGYSLAVGLILASILHWEIFPDCYVEGLGLTPFKIYTEYAICLSLMVAIGLLVNRRGEMDPIVFRLMIWSLAIMIASELAFTFYISVFGVSNVFGHLLKIISFFFVYEALIRSSLTRPYATLFQELNREKQAMQESERKYRTLFANMTQGSFRQLSDGTMIDVNPAALEMLGVSEEEFLNRTSESPALDVVDASGARLPASRHPSMIALATGEAVHNVVIGVFNPVRQERVWLEASAIPEFGTGRNRPELICATLHDITERKRTEAILAARLRLLSQASSLSLAEFLRATLDEVEALTGSEVGFYHFFEEDQVTLSLQAWSTNTIQNMCAAAGEGRHYPVSEAGVWVDCIRQRGPVIHNDYASLAHRKGLPKGHAPVIRELVVPVIREDRILAILGVGNKKTNYDERDVTTVMILADLAWDTAQRKRTEEQLRHSEERFRSALENMLEGCQILDFDWRYIYLNRAAEKHNRCRKEDFLGHTYQETWPGIEKTEVYRVIEACLEKRVTHHMENQFVFPDGSSSWFDLSLQPVPEGVFILSVDITERKRAEERIRVLADMVDNAPNTITVHSMAGRFLYANRKTLEMHGYSEAEFLALNLHQLDVPESEALIAARMAQILNTGEAAFEVEHYRKDGSILPLEVFVRKVDWLGAPAMLSIGTDITERRRLQEQILQAQKMESIGRLAGGVAHDFNNLLAVILGYTEIVAEDLPPDSPFREPVREIAYAGERAKDLVWQLLAFSRKQTLETKVLDINNLVLEVDKMLRRVIGENVQIEVRVNAKPLFINVDSSQFQQVLMNLAVNAQDAMRDGGELILSTAEVVLDARYAEAHPDIKPGEYVLMTVSDTGCGMNKETLRQIFDPFFTTKERGKGTGLGLATVHGIVKQHGGDIQVFSELGQGTTFKVYWPKAHKKGEEHIAERPAYMKGRGETILLVEDEEAVRKIVSAILENIGYTVVVARDAQECFSLADKLEHIDLLFTDVVMPGVNGKEVYERMNALRPGIKTLFMSGYTEDAIEQHGVLEEGVHFIHKPFSSVLLSHKIREILES